MDDRSRPIMFRMSYHPTLRYFSMVGIDRFGRVIPSDLTAEFLIPVGEGSDYEKFAERLREWASALMQLVSVKESAEKRLAVFAEKLIGAPEKIEDVAPFSRKLWSDLKAAHDGTKKELDRINNALTTFRENTLTLDSESEENFRYIYGQALGYDKATVDHIFGDVPEEPAKPQGVRPDDNTDFDPTREAPTKSEPAVSADKQAMVDAVNESMGDNY